MSYCPHCPRHCRSPEDCHAEEDTGPPEDRAANEQRADFYRRELMNDRSSIFQADRRELWPF